VPSAIPHTPIATALPALRKQAEKCRACDLWKNATQTVFGEGAAKAFIMLLGEQPGDQEDRQGRPFVGPAGKLLDEALAEAGIDRSQVYVTNVVKHFKWSPAERGKRRIHKKPAYSEIKACRPWLDAELDAVKPEVVVCLGATAAQAIFGRQFRITQQRGRMMNSPISSKTLATFHPSAILRAPDAESRQAMHKTLVQDLKKAAAALSHS
jgi:uracil-DNA glycosylase family protein